MKAINVKIDQLTNPLGLQNREPRLTWNCDKGIRQTACECRLLINGAEVYNSGRIETDEMSLVLPDVAGDRDRVRVCVVLWDENGVPGEESFAEYEMGISSWEAKWINPELSESKERQPASYLKREFSVEETGLSRLYITCHGL